MMTKEDKKWILGVIKKSFEDIYLDYEVDYDNHHKTYYVDKSYALKTIDEELEKLETE